MTKENSKEEITLKELILKIKEWFLFILSKWKIILLFSIIGSICGYLYSRNKKTIYVAELTFIVENDKPMVLQGSLSTSLGFDIGGSSNEGVFSNANMIELFKSRRMVEKTLLTAVPSNNKNISLADMYLMINKSEERILDSKNIIFPLNKYRQDYSRKQDSILGTIFNDLTNKYLKIDQLDNNSSIFKVEMKYKNELFAKYFLEALAKVVSDDYYELKTKKSKINMLLLQRQTDSVRVELYNSINASEDKKYNKLNPEINDNRVSSKKLQVDIEINTKILTEFIKQLEISKVAVRKDTPLIQIIDRPILPLAQERFGNMKGIELGAVLAGFLMVVILIFKRIFDKILNS